MICDLAAGAVPGAATVLHRFLPLNALAARPLAAFHRTAMALCPPGRVRGTQALADARRDGEHPHADPLPRSVNDGRGKDSRARLGGPRARSRRVCGCRLRPERVSLLNAMRPERSAMPPNSRHGCRVRLRSGAAGLTEIQPRPYHRPAPPSDQGARSDARGQRPRRGIEIRGCSASVRFVCCLRSNPVSNGLEQRSPRSFRRPTGI